MNSFEMYARIFGIPVEILTFFYDVFELHEVRGRVGQVQGIVFEVRSREANHNTPHVHASYAEFNISIAIDDSRILDGNLPPPQEKKAIRWVRDNKEYLQGKWNSISIRKEFPMHISALSMK